MWSIPPPARSSCAPCSTIKDNKLFPSQFVNVRLLVDTLHNQTVVPVAAIQRGADGTFVFVVTPDKTVDPAHRQDRACRTATRSQILSGLKAGDTVVVDGADRLRDGADVEIPNPTGKIAAPSGAGADDAARAARRGPGGRPLSTRPAARTSRSCAPTPRPARARCACACSRIATRSALTAPRRMSQMRRGGGGGGRRGRRRRWRRRREPHSR